jgi:threonyl-tRNA synthetase
MKTLYIHSDYLEYTVKKSTPVADQITEEEKQGRFEEVLIDFISVEKQDEEDLEGIARRAVDDLLEVAKKVKAERVVLYWACDGAIAVFSLGKRKNSSVTVAPSYLRTSLLESRKGHWIF